MSNKLSTGEHFASIEETDGGSQMEKQAKEKIKEIKEIKRKSKLTYIDIMEEMEQINPESVVSLSSLRRICRDGSEMKASSFNFEEILMPVYNAVKSLEKKPKSDSPFDKELDGYKAVIRVQNEELDRLLDLKEHLDDRVEYLVRSNDAKDEIVKNLMDQLKEKEEMLKHVIENRDALFTKLMDIMLRGGINQEKED